LQNKEKYQDLLSNWACKKINGNKTIDEFLTFDKDIHYWTFHRFRFFSLSYNIPFRDSDTRYQPIINKKKESFLIQLRTKVIYFGISIYLNFTILYFLFISLFANKNKKRNGTEKKRIGILTHESEIKINSKEKITDIYRTKKIYDELIKEKKKPLIIVGTQLLKPWKKPKNKGDYIKVLDYSTLNIFKNSISESIKIHKKWKNLNIKNKQNAFQIEGQSIFTYVKDDLNFLFSFPIIFANIYYYYLFKEIIKTENLGSILTISGIRERCALAACYKQNIPGIYLAHATQWHGKYYEFFPNTNYFVFSESDKQKILEGSKINNNKIKAVGPYLIDDVINKYKNKKSKEKDILIFSQHKYVDYGEKKYSEFLKKAFESLKGFKNIKIKMHPRDKKEYLYSDALEFNGIKDYEIIKSIQSNKNQNILYDSILNASITISFGSAAILDALALKKPTLVIKFNKKDSIFPEAKSLTYVNYSDNYSKILKKMIEDKTFRKNIKKNIDEDIKYYYHKLDGKSAERIAKNIIKLNGEK
jgi:hypothetical protein